MDRVQPATLKYQPELARREMNKESRKATSLIDESELKRLIAIARKMRFRVPSLP